jgi:sialidase-1
MKCIAIYIILLALFPTCCAKIKERTTQTTVLWVQRTGKYNNYRIPSLIVTQKGILLAFCEGREAGDAGDINILLKRTEDNGKTWSS